MKKRSARPLFMDTNYISSSLDSFPIEFLNMRGCFKVLLGEDVLADGTAVVQYNALITGVFITFYEEADLSIYRDSAYCGISDWELGVPTDISECYTLWYGGPLALNSTYYNVYALQYDFYYRGFIAPDMGLTPETRSDTLDYIGHFERQ